mmetsp:Transcript_50071/g.98936  ORF Transcript_50071/g.98936 Transcript_50071/m.98936 type:complete len:245 (+) Transcript_50071:3-737(+)
MSSKERESLCRELAILQTVSHDHVVQMYGAIPHNPIRIITELCSGGSCFELLHEAPDVELTWNQKIKICTDTAHAMIYLHSFEPPIIHRDLKSLNLLLVERVRSICDVPTVKLSDFGLSRLREKHALMTRDVGTCHWMAPEIFQSLSYDEKVDVYSYAMLLYEVILRRVPFVEIADKKEIANRVKRGERPSLAESPGDCPSMLQSLIRLCWHQDPCRRPDFEHVDQYLQMATSDDRPQGKPLSL